MALFEYDTAGLPVDELIEEMGATLAARYATVEDLLLEAAARRAYRIRDLEERAADATTEIARQRALRDADVARAAALAELRGIVADELARIRREDLAGELVRVASTAGQAAAAAQLVPLGRRAFPTATSSTAVAALEFDLRSKLTVLNQRITRFPNDMYQQVMSVYSPRIILGAATTRQAQRAAVQAFLSEGIGHINYLRKDGSTHLRMPIGSYAEMVGRTSTQRAWQEAATVRMQQSGINLGTIVGGIDACSRCAPWIGRIISLDGTTGTVYVAHATRNEQVEVQIHGTVEQARASGWGHPNCFPGWVPVSAPTGIAGADTRWFEGQVVVIHTAGGRELTVTPNHPVLTTEGWIAAGQLMKGQHVLSYSGNVQEPVAGGPDHEGVETSIREVYETLGQSSHVTAVSVPGSPEQFHGDGSDAEVEVVFADRLLQANGKPESFKLSPEGAFLVSSVGLSPLLAESPFAEVVVRSLHAAHCGVSGAGESSAFFRAGFGEAGAHSGGSVALLNAGVTERAVEGSGADIDGGRELLSGLTGLIALDQIVDIRNDEFRGHVYNLHTGDGWYTADSIIVHNCRDRIVAYAPGLSIVQGPVEYNPAAEKERADQRKLERDIRAAKRDVLTAADDVTRRRAENKVREKQAEMRAFLARTGRARRSYREQTAFSHGDTP